MRRLARHRRLALGLVTVSALLAGCEIVVTTAPVEPVELHARYDFFTVNSYGMASVTLFGLTTSQDLGWFTIDAFCMEEGYPGATTYLSGSTTLYAGEIRSVTLWYESGDPYFGYDTVWCSFDGETAGGREVIVSPYYYYYYY